MLVPRPRGGTHVRFRSVWPKLPVAEWIDTRDTLQLMTQVVGKVRMENTPLMSHWWNVVLYVSARGLTTGLIPYGDRGFSIDFDFIDHQLVVSTTNGDRRALPLKPGPIADFYRDVMAALDELGLSTEIWTMPVEIPEAIPFDTDRQHVAYDGDQAHRFWLALVQMNRVFEMFRSRYHRQGQPGALLLGRARSGGDTVLWPSGAQTSWRRAELRSARDVGGVLPRGEQRGILARARTARGSSTPTPTRTSRVSGRVRFAGTGSVRRRSR